MAFEPEELEAPPDIGGMHELARQLGAARMPPHSLEAEQAVLGGLLVATSEGFDRVSDMITERDFYEFHHRLIYRAIAAIVTGNGNSDVVTVVSWLDQHGLLEDAQGLSYVGALPEVTPSAANIKAYASIVRERSVMRQLIKVATEIADSAFDSEGRSSKELLDEAETKVFGIADQTAQNAGGFQDIKTVLAGAIERINTLFESDAAITGIATGFDDLDEKTSGLQRSDLIIIAGRPSMGKTTFAMNIAEHVALTASSPVAVFSMEMPAEQLGMRLISSLGRVELQKLRTGRLSEQDWPRISSAITLLNQKQSVYIDDTPALTPTDLRARARRLAREHGLSLIVIDYLQLMKGSASSNENRATEISEISRSLKALAKELDVPIIALSQLNRALEQRPDKRPVMSDLRECVTGDTLVALADGTRRPIETLVGERPEVLSVDAAGRIRRSRAEPIWKVGRRPAFRVRLASGRSIACTAEHRLLGYGGWREVGELEAGDRLAIPRSLPEPEITVPAKRHELVLLGHLIGNGSYLDGQPLRYSAGSEANGRAVAGAAAKFGCPVTRLERGRGRHTLVIGGDGNRRGSAGVGAWLEGLGMFGRGSADKRVPEFVFKLPNDQLALFLRHLWATDGSVHVGEKHECRVRLSTPSGRLADDIAALLLRFGIVSRTERVFPASGGNGRYTIDVGGREQQLRFAGKIGGFGHQRDAIRELREILGGEASNRNVDVAPAGIPDDARVTRRGRGTALAEVAISSGTGSRSPATLSRSRPSCSSGRAVLAGCATASDDRGLERFTENDLFWDRVVALEPVGESEVYDISVPLDSSFIGCDVVNHNSGAIEQDADVIMFIYRDEVYNPDDEASKGKAEILIRKQRNGPIGSCMLTFLGMYTRFENYSPEIMGGEFS